jgi:CBS domain-containing protein
MASIKEHIIREVISLDASASCAEAARVMIEHGIGSVGVRRGSKLVGLVTERDLIAQVSGQASLDRTSLAVAMPADLPAVSPDSTDRECALLMRSRHTRHLAVKEGDEIVGVLSMLDLVDLVVEEKQWSIDQLESYIRGGRTRQLSEPITTLFSHDREGT